MLDLIKKLAEVSSELRANQLIAEGHMLASKEDYMQMEQRQIEASLQNSYQELLDRMHKGHDALEEAFKKLPKEKEDSFRQQIEVAKKAIAEVSSKVAELEKRSLQRVIGLSDELALWIYQVAYQSFKEGKLEESFALFFSLVLLNSFVCDYWFALACTQKALKSYRAALLAFSVVSLLDPDHTQSRIQCAEIYLKEKEASEAMKELEALSIIIETKQLDHLRPELERLQALAIEKGGR